MTRFAAAAVMAGCLLASGARGADMRVAVIDMDRVLQAFPETKASRTALEKQLEEYEAEQKGMLSERDKLVKEVESAREAVKNEALSAPAREKLQTALDEKTADLRKYEREIRDTASLRQRQLNDQRMRMQRRIVGRLRELVKTYCEKERIDLVVDSASMGAQGVEVVLYSNEKMDITQPVLAMVSKEPVRALDKEDAAMPEKDPAKKTNGAIKAPGKAPEGAVKEKGKSPGGP